MPDNGRRRQQRYPLVALLLALSFLFPLSAQARIFKCVAANGEITFSQTPCPKEIKETTADEEDARDVSMDSDEFAPEHTDDPNADDKEAVPAETAYAINSAQPIAPQPDDGLAAPEKKPETAAMRLKKRQSDARDEEYRLQCKDNIKSQINSINSQMRSSSYSASLADSLKKKRRALEVRLNDC